MAQQLAAQFAAGPRDSCLAFTLAELNYSIAQADEASSIACCVDRYFLAAAFAWHGLFAADAPAHSDPRRLRCAEIYNSSVAKCLETAQRLGRFDASRALRINMPGGPFAIPIEYHGFSWAPQEFGELRVVGDYDSDDLTRRYVRRGLGAPMVGIRRRLAKDAPAERFFPDNLPFAVSAVLRPNLDRLLGVGPPGTAVAGTLELYDPTQIASISVAGQPINLAADLTAPWALALTDPDRTRAEWGGFFSPDDSARYSGLYMLEPYQRGKIPIVLVHGLLSGPLTWSDMINELRADATLRERCQLWVFRYPSGGPLLHAAARLRGDLRAARLILDASHSDPALDHMLVMGHSLGGLIGKLQASYSGDILWRRYANRPLESLQLLGADYERLRRWFFFNPQPWVKRVIYLATPHRGARLRNQLIGRFASTFVRMPDTRKAAVRIVGGNPTAFKATADELLASSVDLLLPYDRLSLAVRELPVDPGVKFHSIIGSGQMLLDGSDSDGVVTVDSARVTGVASELLTPARHAYVHRHEASIQEVKRILYEHLAEFDGTWSSGRKPRSRPATQLRTLQRWKPMGSGPDRRRH